MVGSVVLGLLWDVALRRMAVDMGQVGANAWARLDMLASFIEGEKIEIEIQLE